MEQVGLIQRNRSHWSKDESGYRRGQMIREEEIEVNWQNEDMKFP